MSPRLLPLCAAVLRHACTQYRFLWIARRRVFQCWPCLYLIRAGRLQLLELQYADDCALVTHPYQMHCRPFWQLWWEPTVEWGCLSTTQRQKPSASGPQNLHRHHQSFPLQIPHLLSFHISETLEASYQKAYNIGSRRPQRPSAGWETGYSATVTSIYTEKLQCKGQYAFPPFSMAVTPVIWRCLRHSTSNASNASSK